MDFVYSYTNRVSLALRCMPTSRQSQAASVQPVERIDRKADAWWMRRNPECAKVFAEHNQVFGSMQRAHATRGSMTVASMFSELGSAVSSKYRCKTGAALLRVVTHPRVQKMQQGLAQL